MVSAVGSLENFFDSCSSRNSETGANICSTLGFARASDHIEKVCSQIMDINVFSIFCAEKA